ncbi:hypothetical protein Pint_13528 [Pistacia integerrima]|uniref:Uncharacterized protein n=1 Tax=Pistacia integerrima TaxID=434235 RepID=A0ACC0Y4Q1_9ROSI|nr:hypothetical protein Pint_13528 [Pistacia integerrima]
MMATSNVVLVHEENTYRNLHQPAVIIGGCFALAAVSLSLFLILQHLRSYTNPAEQKWIVAVLFIVPVYASESILSLWKPRFSLPCDILRNCYEAFALYSFGSYLIACLGGERRTIEFLESKSRKQLSKPLLADENQVSQKGWFSNFFFRPCVLGKDLFSIQKFGLVQYMILKTLCAFLALVLELCGVYGDGEFKWYPYIAVVLNFSQMWALYCLVNFYNGVGIALLCALGVLPNKGKLKNGLQDFLICIEFCMDVILLLSIAMTVQISMTLQMAIAAVAHMFVFSAEFYRYLPAAEPGKLTTRRTEERIKLEEKDKKPAMLEKTKIQIEAPGTSISESVQDIVVEGGQRVVEDVVLTINQAMGPVEKGVTKIQEKLHSKSLSSDDKEGEWEFKVEEHVEENLTGTKNSARV